jgi:alpha-D-ribose 1-methylphosphonate 5-triphosphate diphosphatase PhnM
LLMAIDVALILSGEPIPNGCDPPPSSSDGNGNGVARAISGAIAIAPGDAEDHFLAAASKRLLEIERLRLTPQEALEAITADAAFALAEEASRGVIAPGRRADFAVLDRNPLATPGEAWAAISVEAFSAASQ